MREVERQQEKGKKPGDELRKRTPISLAKISAIRVSNPRSFAPIHPPQFCYGGRVRGSNPAFNIKKPSQNLRKPLKVNKGKLRVFLAKKFRIFLAALLREIIGESQNYDQKNRSNWRKKHAVFDVLQKSLKSQPRSECFRGSGRQTFALRTFSP
jgi:hypothetical protein